MKEALKLALEALTYIYTETTADEDELIDQAITALRLAIDVQNMASESTYKAALAQPAQEPVFCEYCGGNDESPPNHCMDCARPQRTWVGLDEKDFSAINQSCLTKLQAATSAESVLKEKNNG